MPASRDQADRTQRVLLPDETGPVPVSIVHAEPHWFGVPPPLLLFGLAAFSFVLALVLLATGSWPFGLILLGLSALLAAAFLEIARRRPGSKRLRAAHSWSSSRLELARAHAKAIGEVQALRGRRAVIESERRSALLRLAEATQSSDEEAAVAARTRLEELEQADKALDGRLEERRTLADERIRRVRMSIEETMVVVPEPYPAPDEDAGRPAA